MRKRRLGEGPSKQMIIELRKMTSEPSVQENVRRVVEKLGCFECDDEGSVVATRVKKLDNLIDAWHKSDSELELHEYLGMTWEEYCAFVEKGF